MDKTSLVPYAFFDGDCREAMEFYKSIFGGQLSSQTRGEVDPGAPDDMKNKIIHARLEGEIILMASDNMDGSDRGRGKVALSISGYDEAKLRQIFDNLSQGGTINNPLKKEFWGDIFGTLTDKYGIDWMVNITAKKEG